MSTNLEQFRNQSNNLKKENRQFFDKLKLKKPKNLDEHFHNAHDDVFEEMDCLDCANCCKTTSPIFYQKDIERASKRLRLKPGDFIDRYLKIDEDKDYVLQTAPCPFLGPDNYCSIYEDRPNACREYPHTDRKKMVQVLDLTYKNTLVCPAVLKITEKVKKSLGM
jgi:Fe-S-cluster containining protein